MPRRIESIIIEKFKGATNKVTIDFDASKPVIMIFGENGTGKSTIIDAIDFVCNGNFGSIEQRSTTGSKADLMASLGSGVGNLKAEINYAGNVWTGIIGHGRKPESTGTGNKPAVKILRRGGILKIVDGQPKDRYEALKSFINVPKAESIENALRNAVNDTDKKYNDAVKAYQQAEQSLKDLWEAEGKPEGDYKKWARSKSEIDATTLTKSSSHLNSIIQKMNNCDSALKSSNDSDTTYKAAEQSYSEAEQKYNSVRKSIKGIERDIVDVLEKAKDFISKYPTIEYCPVCEKAENAKELTGKIDKRLASLKSLIDFKKAFETAQKNMEGQKKVLFSKKKDWVTQVHDLALFVKNSTVPEIDSLGITWPDYSGLLAFSKSDDPDSTAPAAATLSERLSSTKRVLELRKQREEKEFNQLNAIKIYFRTYNEKNVQAQHLEKQFATLKKLNEIVEKERKDFVENELGSISGVVNNLYTKIHPEEGLGKVKPESCVKVYI